MSRSNDSRRLEDIVYHLKGVRILQLVHNDDASKTETVLVHGNTRLVAVQQPRANGQDSGMLKFLVRIARAVAMECPSLME